MRSPGGSTFPYHYLGGEIHCLKYGQRGADLDALAEVVAAEEEFLAQLGQSQRVWVDLYGTRLTREGRLLLVRHLDALRPVLVRLAVVGAGVTGAARLRRAAHRDGRALPAPTRFFADPEAAKTWLVQGGA